MLGEINQIRAERQPENQAHKSLPHPFPCRLAEFSALAVAHSEGQSEARRHRTARSYGLYEPNNPRPTGRLPSPGPAAALPSSYPCGPILRGHGAIPTEGAP